MGSMQSFSSVLRFSLETGTEEEAYEIKDAFDFFKVENARIQFFSAQKVHSAPGSGMVLGSRPEHKASEPTGCGI
jgi:hypothetical protein